VSASLVPILRGRARRRCFGRGVPTYFKIIFDRQHDLSEIRRSTTKSILIASRIFTGL
jgi:hypothetical protein